MQVAAMAELWLLTLCRALYSERRDCMSLDIIDKNHAVHPLDSRGRTAVVPANTKWDAVADGIVKKLWEEGESAGSISQQLRRKHYMFSRNAVIGRVHRMRIKGGWSNLPARRDPNKKLSFRDPKKKKPMLRRGGVPRKTHKAPTPELLFLQKQLRYTTVIVPQEERRNVLTVKSNQCRWSMTDPKDPDFHFCNCDALPGLSFCQVHAARAYIAPIDLRRQSA